MDHVICIHNYKTGESSVVDGFYKREAYAFMESYLYDYIVSLNGLTSMPIDFNNLVFSHKKKPSQDNILYIRKSKVNMNKFTIIEKKTDYGLLYNEVKFIKHISIYCFKDNFTRSNFYDVNNLFYYKPQFDQVINNIKSNFEEIKML
jgi:hypothetical protein